MLTSIDIVFFLLYLTAPLDPDETIYSLAFKEKEKVNSTHASTNGHGPNTNQNKKPAVQKKKRPDQEIKKKEKPIDADEAIAQV